VRFLMPWFWSRCGRAAGARLRQSAPHRDHTVAVDCRPGRRTAAALTKQIADRTATIPGYDAQVVARMVNATWTLRLLPARKSISLAVDRRRRDDKLRSTSPSDHRIGTMQFALVNAQLAAALTLRRSSKPLHLYRMSLRRGCCVHGASYVLRTIRAAGQQGHRARLRYDRVIKKLPGKGVVAVATEPLDQAQAGASIPQLCKEHSARGVLHRHRAPRAAPSISLRELSDPRRDTRNAVSLRRQRV